MSVRYYVQYIICKHSMKLIVHNMYTYIKNGSQTNMPIEQTTINTYSSTTECMYNRHTQVEGIEICSRGTVTSNSLNSPSSC